MLSKITSGVGKINKKRYQPQTVVMVFIVLCVGLTGVVLLSFSRASTHSINLNPESGTLASGATAITDASASGGQAVKFNSPNSDYNATATFPASLTVGQTGQFSASFTSATTQTGMILDAEIYNSQGQRVHQYYKSDQTIGTAPVTISWSWTPQATGTYTFKLGIFTSGWAANTYFNHNAGTLTASAGTAGDTVVYDEQFSGTYTHRYSDNGIYPNLKHPSLFMEWSGVLPVSVSNGTGKITGNSATGSSANGFHRMFSTKRYGGPGKSLKIMTKVRMTKLYSDNGWGGYRGVKLGLKFPASGTGYSQEDPMSVKGTGNLSSSPGSMIFVTGIMEDGRTELARNGYGTAKYLPFQNGPKIPYTLNTWKDITIQIDWLPSSTKMRIRYWQNPGGSGTPIFDWTDQNSPFQEPGFLWYRTDFSDFEYDFVRIEQKNL